MNQTGLSRNVNMCNYAVHNVVSCNLFAYIRSRCDNRSPLPYFHSFLLRAGSKPICITEYIDAELKLENSNNIKKNISVFLYFLQKMSQSFGK